MKILWIVASPVGSIKSVLFNEHKEYTSGHWIDYTMKSLNEYDSTTEIGYMTTSNIDNTIKMKEGNTTYYCINAGVSKVGKKFKSKHKTKVINVIEDFKPDLIQVWGTETGLGLLVREVAPQIPMVVVFQGIMNAIEKYPNGGLNLWQLTKHSLLDLLKLPYFNKINKMYSKQSSIEKELIEKVDHIISESDWAFGFAKSLNRNINTHWFPLQLNSIFYNKEWKKERSEKHSIFSVSGRGAHKGLHNIIIAVGLLKKEYPDITLYIPGNSKVNNNGIINNILKTPYDSYLEKLLKKYNIEKNIVFTGVLSPNEVANYLQKVSLFVMPSSIENQSASLREAMAMGVPSISANVGCVDEVVIHKKTGILYRYEEYEVLANNISLLFENEKNAIKIGNNGKKLMSTKYYNLNGGEILHSIYKSIITNEL